MKRKIWYDIYYVDKPDLTPVKIATVKSPGIAAHVSKCLAPLYDFVGTEAMALTWIDKVNSGFYT